MIIKNIAPYSKEIKSIKLYLMPGQEADISEYSAKQRQDCFELQEAFRKGEFICVGVGRNDRAAPSTEARAKSAFSQGAHGAQPYIKITPEYIPSLEGSETIHRRYEASDEDKVASTVKYGRRERKETQQATRPDGILERDPHGVVGIRPIERIPTLPKNREEPKPVELPTITRERAREIITASQCIGIGSSGHRCKRRPVTGYEYCIMHMPKNVREEYRNKKTRSFFKE